MVADEAVRRSHVQRANHHVEPASAPNSLRVFRQGYEFMEAIDRAPGFEVGLNFVSFQDTPERLFRMLTQQGWLGRVNFGGHEPGDLVDPGASGSQLLSVRAAAVYVVPPVVDGEPFPGAGIFL